MEKGEMNELFTSSGCLTEEALFRHNNGLLQDAELLLVDDHVKDCELCTLALEGFALAGQESFSEDINWLNQAFSGKKELSDATPNEESIQVNGLPSLGSHFFRTSKGDIIGSTQEPAETIAPDAVKKPEQSHKRTFWSRYRIELIAASLLLLIAIGGSQVYIELKQSQNSENQAALAVKPDQFEEAIVEMAIKPESSEVAGKTTEQKTIAPPVVQVENDLSLNVVEVTSDDVVMAETIPSTDAESAALAYGEKEKNVEENPEKFETNEPIVDKYIEGVIVTNRAMKSGSLSQEIQEEEIAEAEIFTVVEETPQFPGGDEARIRFLTENIKYPQEAREASIHGTVYITFVVERDGTIEDVRVLRGIGGGCDEEAVRVIRKMPRWLPGKQRGKSVRVQFNMPIKFSLAG